MVFRSTILVGILLNFIGLDEAVDTSEVMLKVTIEFGIAIVYCQEQMGFSDDVIIKIRHFWHGDYEGRPQEMACVLHCAVKRLELADDQGNLIHGHVLAFLKAQGADNETAKQLLDIVTKECNNNAISDMANVPEHCLKAMIMTNCLRTSILKKHMEPSFMEHTTPDGKQYSEVFI